MVIPGNNSDTTILRNRHTMSEHSPCLDRYSEWILRKVMDLYIAFNEQVRRMCLGRLGSWFDECKLENAVNT